MLIERYGTQEISFASLILKHKDQQQSEVEEIIPLPYRLPTEEQRIIG